MGSVAQHTLRTQLQNRYCSHELHENGRRKQQRVPAQRILRCNADLAFRGPQKHGGSRKAVAGKSNRAVPPNDEKLRHVAAQFVGSDIQPSAATYENQSTESLLLSCSTFNVLAPIYKRLGGREDLRESTFRHQWMPRNQRIVQQLIAKHSSIICLQELWLSNPELVALYDNALGAHGYDTFKLPRPNGRGDGLLTAVRTDKLEVVEHEDLHFNDCGDRVAQFLWLRSRAGCCSPLGGVESLFGAVLGGKLGRSSIDPCQEVIVINTHLLFPHDRTSSFIRLRQVYKVLEHLEDFKARNNLSSVPVVICGDLNGTKRGQVYTFLRSQGFVSSYDIANNHPDSDERWVSHKNHHGKVCGVDYIWLLNPSERRSQLALDWKAAVFKYLKQKLENIGCEEDRQAFNFFCNPEDADMHEGDGITLSSMQSAVDKIGKELALTEHELAEIMASADMDGEGKIGFQKFKSVLQRSASAADLSIKKGCPSNTDRSAVTDDVDVCSTGLAISDANLYPPEMEEGVWPSHYTLSDHALLTAVFTPTEKTQ